MSKIIIEKIEDDIFGNLVHLTNGIIELKASLDFGPRILHYSLCGMDNVFYNDKDKKPISNIAYSEFDGDIFKLYGGHRLWVSPEIMPRCYYPDNKPVGLTIKDFGVVLEAPVENFNNIQKRIEISINEYSAEVTVTHSITNKGAWNTVFAPWAITVMAQGGTLLIPQADRPTGFLPNRSLAIWPYTKLNDKRLFFGENYITVKQDPTIVDKLKIGTNNEKEWVAYFSKGQIFLKNAKHTVGGFYPDLENCSFETYTDDICLETETLGQVSVVEPNCSASHIERWNLHKEDFIPNIDEDEISDIINNYL